jgi:hypothetical protein
LRERGPRARARLSGHAHARAQGTRFNTNLPGKGVIANRHSTDSDIDCPPSSRAYF